MIAWIVEFTLPEDADREIIAILTYRAHVMAFLENDERPNYRRFVHSQLYNHFLAESLIDAILEDELPKFVRRNILGADFLSVFNWHCIWQNRTQNASGNSSDAFRIVFGPTRPSTEDHPISARCS